MLSEYEKLINRENRILKQFYTNPVAWENFLTIAGRLYDEVTSNQVLIANQNPKATILKTVEEWNQKYCCYLKPEVKPIKLMIYNSGQRDTKAVYDIKDVCQAVDSIEIPKPWTIREEHKEPIMKMLEKEVGPTDPCKSFEGRIMQISDQIIDHNKEELIKRAYGAGFAYKVYTVEFPYREKIDLAIQEIFANSLSYLLLSRCGKNMREWRKQRDFRYLKAFDRLPLISWTACTLSGLGKPVLMGIAQTIEEYHQPQIVVPGQAKAVITGSQPKKIEKGEDDKKSTPFPQTPKKTDKVAETPVEKNYIRKKLDTCKQQSAQTGSNETPKKKEAVL